MRFARVRKAYDLDHLRRSRVIVTGNGGAIGWVEGLARCGVGTFVLIDPDVVSWSNIATQDVYEDEVGQPKVKVLKRRIKRINRDALVIAKRARIEDFTDEEVAELCGKRDGSLPAATLLCGMTDSFWAQARINRLALNLGVPSLCAQLYAEGRGAEATFTYPGLTDCHRCMLRPRYRAYVDEGFVNDVGSDSTPIFATTRLNALKGFVALAILHHGTSHPRWGSMLERIGRRSLLQIRMDPDCDLPAFRGVLDGERVFFDETLWIPRGPWIHFHGMEPCPDCLGMGASPKLVGWDTREIRR